jgi:hypothetical protein
MNKPVYNVRIDPELYELLSLEAKAQDRSITSLINVILKRVIITGSAGPKRTPEQLKARMVVHKLRHAKAKARNEGV